ncbi:MAG TPA: hypothetical protein VLS89_16475 [Candidatus Nanopelagicales bacterium]|nr:hypothetical protein [Candidatus Nanopelagicales bacterium]
MLYFLRGGHRVELEPHERAVAFQGTGGALARLSSSLVSAGVRVLGVDDEAGVLVADVPSGDLVRAKEAAQDEEIQGQVRVVSAYRRPGGAAEDLWVPTGRISVRFPESWSEAEIEAALKRRRLRRREAIEGMPGGILVSVDEGDPVEAARALVEEDRALFADPDFLRRFSLRTGTEAAGAPVGRAAGARSGPAVRRSRGTSGRAGRARPRSGR